MSQPTSMPEVRFRKKDPSVTAPVYKTAGAAGCDICAAEKAIIQPGQRRMISTGLYIEVPPGYECQVRPRSGLAAKDGITVLNSPGTVDSDFRGEMMILLLNTGLLVHTVMPGDRIAQLIFAPVTRVTFAEVDELTETERGAGGWGSTGR